MQKTIKWILIGGGGLAVFIIAALLIIPMFVDLEKYKPEIEKQVADVTGRSFSIGDDLKLSLFPWAGISFTNLRLGNPSGFEEKEFVTIASFDVRAKLIPLMFGDVQVKRFVVDAPNLTLVRNKDGKGNWEFPGGKAVSSQAKGKETSKERSAEQPPDQAAGKLPLKALAVGEFAITNGTIRWIDHTSKVQKRVSDVSLQLKDVSFDRPIQLAFSAQLDQKPLSLNGTVGPLGKDFMKATIPLELNIGAMKQIEVHTLGKLQNLAGDPKFDLNIKIASFSPRALLTELEAGSSINTTDPEVLTAASLAFHLNGTPKQVTLSKGELNLDQSKLKFDMAVKEFDKPDLTFDINLDQIDLDRYLPPASPESGKGGGSEGRSDSSGAGAGEGESGQEARATAKKKPAGEAKIDYTPLRRLVLDGKAGVKKLKVKNARIQDIKLRVTANKGLIQVRPMTLALYEGTVSAKAAVNVKKDTPRSSISVQADGIQAAPLLKDLADKDILEGVAKADLSISAAGDDPQQIKGTLNGKGNLVFNDGAIVGIDLASMVRNVKVAFGLADAGGPKPRTDFAELGVPFTIKNGLVRTTHTRMQSPLIRVVAKGKAHLVEETLDFRVAPKFVATIKGQGDTQQRSGLMVPVLIDGTFSEPKFRPDLKGMLQQTLTEGVPDLKKTIPDADQLKKQGKNLQDSAKGLLKGLPFGS